MYVTLSGQDFRYELITVAGAHFRGEEKNTVIVAQWSGKKKCNEGGNVEDTSTRGHQGFK